MSVNARLAGRSSPLLWGGVALGLVVVLVLSFVMAGSALDGAKADAEDSAERSATSGIASQLEPEQAEADIAGPAYRALLPRVQAEILSDEDVVAVRIWRPDGELIFSTLARDDVETLVAPTPEIASAAGGTTTSIVTRTPTPQIEASQDLFVTYVPLRVGGEPDPLGAVEIDRRYGAITAEASRIWRPVQIASAIGLVAAAVLFGLALRGSAGVRRVRSAQAPTRDERRIGEAEERATAAERAAREAEGRLADAERRLAEAAKAEVSPEARARIEELDLKLRAEQAEREQFAGEAEELRSALRRAETSLAEVRDTQATSDRERAASADAIARAEALAVEAERRAAAADTLAAAESDRATTAEARVAELESRVADLEAGATSAHERASELESAAGAAGARIAELEAAAASAHERAAELESAAGAAQARIAELESGARDAGPLADELDVLRLDLERARVELDAAREELDASESRAIEARRELQRSDEERQRVASELERSEAQREHLAGELERANAGPESATAELEERLAHLESQRRDEIAELQRLQEALANTQLELLDANRKLRVFEERAGAPDDQPASALEPARSAEPVPPTEPESRRPEPEERAPAFGEPRPRPARRPPASEPLPGAAPAASEPDEVEDEEAPEVSEEGLSLRERLARAAAARHRTTQPPD